MYRIRTNLTGLPGSPWVSNLYFDEAGGTANEAATAVSTFFEALDNYMSSNVLWAIEPEVSLINPASGAPTGLTAVEVAGGQGDLAVESMPPGDQIVIRWRTGVFSGRRERRGRMFVPGLTQDANDQGKVIAATRTGVGNAATALIASATCALVVWHRPTDDPPTNGAASIVTASSVWDQFGHLRTRRD
jgi:hypothetical protein